MTPELRKFPDAPSLARAAAGDWLAVLARNAGRGPFAVALSGGRIARDFFSETVRQARESSPGPSELFRNVHFFWADERCVPPDDPESNYGVARKLLFEPLKIPEAQIHRIHGEEDEALALREAVKNITSVAGPGAGNGQPIVPLVLLGMGEDGHVASLFPGELAGEMASPEVYRAVTAVKPPPRRITLGYGVLASATEVWVLASGEGKEQALRQSLSPQGKTPLARVLRSRAGGTRIYTDVIGG